MKIYVVYKRLGEKTVRVTAGLECDQHWSGTGRPKKELPKHDTKDRGIFESIKSNILSFSLQRGQLRQVIGGSKIFQ